VSPEEAGYGTAGRKDLRFTGLEDGELVVRIELRADEGAVVVARSLAEAVFVVATSWQHSLLQMRPMRPENRTIWTIRTLPDVSGVRVQG
jgi:hypothetical protein